MNVPVAKIIRTKRKTVGLQITHDGVLVLRAPFFVGRGRLRQIIQRHRKWITRRIGQVREQERFRARMAFSDGGEFLYLGKACRLTVADEPREFFTQGGFFISKSGLPKARERFICWYKERAIEKFRERLEYYTRLAGEKYWRVAISDAKRRWGSCSAKGSLRFSWKLIMAPAEVIDYVVVHEAAHLSVKNHSKDFWDKVGRIMPDYKLRRAWLKENSHLLSF